MQVLSLFLPRRACAHTHPALHSPDDVSLQSVSLHSSALAVSALFHIHSLAGNHLVKVTGDHIPNPLSTSSTDLTNACSVGHCRPAIPGAFPLLASRAMPLRVLVPAQPASLLARQQADLWERRLPFPTPLLPSRTITSPNVRAHFRDHSAEGLQLRRPLTARQEDGAVTKAERLGGQGSATWRRRAWGPDRRGQVCPEQLQTSTWIIKRNL